MPGIDFKCLAHDPIAVRFLPNTKDALHLSTISAIGTPGPKVGLRPRPKGCEHRTPAHPPAFPSGDLVPRTPCPSAAYIIDFNSILENINDVNGRGTHASEV